MYTFGVAFTDKNKIRNKMKTLCSGYDVAGDTCGVDNQPIDGVQDSGKNLEDKG